MLVIQIETLDALDEVEKIAAIYGVDGLFFGPADFSQAAGFLGEFTCEANLRAMDRISAAVEKHGKWWASLGSHSDLYTECASRGARIIGIGSDVGLVRRGIRHINSSIPNKGIE